MVWLATLLAIGHLFFVSHLSNAQSNVARIESHEYFREFEQEVQQLKGKVGENEGLGQSFLPLAAYEQGLVSSECQLHAMLTLNSLLTDRWAAQMIDASAKFPSGVLNWNLWWVGSFSECIQVHAQIQQSDFKGKYCTATFTMPKKSSDIGSLALRVGLCVPSSCTSQDVTAALTKFLKNEDLILSANIDKESCQTNDPHEIDASAIAVITIFSVIAILVLVGTVVDVMKVNFNTCTRYFGTLDKVFVCFSAYSNGKKILKTSRSNNNQSVTAINGLYFISLTWVILGNTYYYSMLTLPWNNLKQVAALQENLIFQAVINSTFSIDTFFFIGGYLVASNFFTEMDRNGGKFSVGQFYLRRFLRVIPPYSMVIAFVAGLFYLMGDGPGWSNLAFEQQHCRHFWWRNLLFINNFFPGSEECIPVSWYIPNDMQFYLLSPLLLYPLYKWTHFGLGLLGAFFSCTLLATAVVIGINDIPGIFLINLPPDVSSMQNDLLYVRPYCRMGPYIIGIAAAYLLYKLGPNFKMSKANLAIGWFLATCCNLLILFGVVDYFAGRKSATRAFNLIYGVFSRPAWSLGVAWVTFVCVIGQGGMVNSILSWSPFVPLGRLSYCAYLIHIYIQYLSFGTRENEFFFDNVMVIYFYLGSLTISMAAAFVFSLTFEAPVLALEKFWMQNRSNIRNLNRVNTAEEKPISTDDNRHQQGQIYFISDCRYHDFRSEEIGQRFINRKNV